jgi:hypothetical protein
MHCIQMLALKYRNTEKLREPRTGLLPLSASNAPKQDMNITKIRSKGALTKAPPNLSSIQCLGALSLFKCFFKPRACKRRKNTALNTTYITPKP